MRSYDVEAGAFGLSDLAEESDTERLSDISPKTKPAANGPNGGPRNHEP
jgi:hypothetical protein